jgi:hypothetical protein
MGQDWQVLTQMVQGKEVVVTRVEVIDADIAVEGRFELPPLIKLSLEDQVFIATFAGVHGSIKEMERLFGISYPTVKARLKKITEQLTRLGFVSQEIRETDESILDRLANREITVDEAVKGLKQCSH